MTRRNFRFLSSDDVTGLSNDGNVVHKAAARLLRQNGFLTPRIDELSHPEVACLARKSWSTSQEYSRVLIVILPLKSHSKAFFYCPSFAVFSFALERKMPLSKHAPPPQPQANALPQPIVQSQLLEPDHLPSAIDAAHAVSHRVRWQAVDTWEILPL